MVILYQRNELLQGGISMGCWMVAKGILEVKPEPDISLIKEYIDFSNRTNPYADIDESFPNTWFFDGHNHLQSDAGKFGEPSVWYKEIKKFFEERGYTLSGDPDFIGEGEVMDFWEVCNRQYELYLEWKERCKQYGNAS